MILFLFFPDACLQEIGDVADQVMYVVVLPVCVKTAWCVLFFVVGFCVQFSCQVWTLNGDGSPAIDHASEEKERGKKLKMGKSD